MPQNAMHIDQHTGDFYFLDVKHITSVVSKSLHALTSTENKKEIKGGKNTTLEKNKPDKIYSCFLEMVASTKPGSYRCNCFQRTRPPFFICKVINCRYQTFNQKVW